MIEQDVMTKRHAMARHGERCSMTLLSISGFQRLSDVICAKLMVKETLDSDISNRYDLSCNMTINSVTFT